MVDRPWARAVFELPPEQAAQFLELCVAGDCFGVVVAERGGQAHAEVTLTVAGSAWPEAVLHAARETSVVLPLPDVIAEDALLVGVMPDDPFELLPGLWVDPGESLIGRGGIARIALPPLPAFGDGRHPATRIAAQLMQDLPLERRAVLDLGCGTGLLGVLARRAGCARLVLSDIDEDALRSTRRVLDLNGVTDAEVIASDLIAAIDGPFDVMLANLYADLVLPLLADPRLHSVLPQGALILSGIALQRRDEVMPALRAAGFHIDADREDAWWWGCRANRG